MPNMSPTGRPLLPRRPSLSSMSPPSSQLTVSSLIEVIVTNTIAFVTSPLSLQLDIKEIQNHHPAGGFRMSERLLLTIDEAAARLGIGRSHAYIYVMKGELASVKLGRSRRVPAAALE